MTHRLDYLECAQDVPGDNEEEAIFVNDQSLARKESKDPYAINDEFEPPTGTPWAELDAAGKIKQVAISIGKAVALVLLLYMFICSLSFLSSAFRLLGGKAAGEAFQSNDVMANPVAGLMMGVVATVLLQSSSTTTSIVVAMVSSDIIQVPPAIPVIMGANIGTSVTNTIVAMGQIADKDQFRRAFAGATVHDMFNILCVVSLLPIEVATKYLYYITNAIISSMNLHKSDKSSNPEMLSKLTKPFTNLIIQLDKKIIEKIAEGDASVADKSLLKQWCDKGTVQQVLANVTRLRNVTVDGKYAMRNITLEEYQNVTVHTQPCVYLFHNTGLTDAATGIIMFVASLFVLCVCLVLIVKLLSSLLRGQIAVVIKKTLNSDFPKPFGFLTGYVALLVGAGMTILVQSSSIFTSALTPLVGLGIVSLERVYPLTLGSNIGTTGTGILAALASSADRLAPALQIALCHLFFNISGIALWYPIPQMRRIPIKLAKKLGNITANYRWFAVAYLISLFFLIPGFIFILSLAGWQVFVAVMIPIFLILIFVIVVNILQKKKPSVLPNFLHNWKWLPLMCRSLQPYDDIIVKIKQGMCCRKNKQSDSEVQLEQFRVKPSLEL